MLPSVPSLTLLSSHLPKVSGHSTTCFESGASALNILYCTLSHVTCKPLVLLSDAFIAFLLNIAVVFLVSAGSSLVLTLARVFKDILLIIASVLIFGGSTTPLHVIGQLHRSSTYPTNDTDALSIPVLLKASGRK